MVDIDDRLRSYAARWRDEQPAADVPEVHARPRHAAVLVTLVAVVGLAVGAAVWSQRGGSTREVAARNASDGLVPWSDDPAAPVTTTTVPPASLRPCAPQDVTVGSVEAGAAAGSAVWSVPLLNHTAGGCTLPLVPPVTGLNSSGQRVSLEEAATRRRRPCR